MAMDETNLASVQTAFLQKSSHHVLPAQTASAVIFWEYERQRGKDIARAAKEKAFQEANDEDKRVRFPDFSSVLGTFGLRATATGWVGCTCNTSCTLLTWTRGNDPGGEVPVLHLLSV